MRAKYMDCMNFGTTEYKKELEKNSLIPHVVDLIYFRRIR